jgi:Calcineurin-like phosphoesterase
MTTFKLLGDPHTGKVFINNVPLHRRGDHEKIVWAEFEKQLEPSGAEVHINMGDLYDKPFVPYSTVWRSAQLYLTVAQRYPKTLFVVLRGNHDASRDLEAISAFDLFEGLTCKAENIRCVKDWATYNELVFFGWHPTISADAMVEDFDGSPKDMKIVTAFGHWDTDGRSDPFNLIPTGQLAAAGITKAYTGHVHTPETFTRDGVDVTVHGSMLPYAHGEGFPYVTLTLDEARTMTDVKDLCVRIKLEPGEVFDLELDCLQLQIVRPEEAEQLSVELGEFDLMALFTECMANVPVNIQTEVRTRWDAAFTAKR